MKIFLLLLILAGQNANAQTVYDRRFQLNIHGGAQFGIPPFHHTQQKSLNGTVSTGFAYGINVCYPLPKSRQWLVGMQVNGYHFGGPNGAKKAMLYARYSDPQFYTTVENAESGATLRQLGFTIGYRLPVSVVDLTATLGLNTGYFKAGEQYNIYRKQKDDNYSETITVSGTGGENNEVQFFYPSLSVGAARKLSSWLYAAASASFHAGTSVGMRYVVRREGLYGEQSTDLFIEKQPILHAGLSLGLQWRIGATRP